MAVKDIIPRIGRGRDGSHVARRGEFDPFRGLQRDMNRLFEDFFSDFPLAPRRSGAMEGGAAFTPRVDVSDSGNEVTVSAELPGLEQKDVTVEVDDGAVTLRGEKREQKEEKGRNWQRRESSYGSFHRVVPLPSHVDAEKARARFRNGVLTVTAPKRQGEESRQKSIRIETD